MSQFLENNNGDKSSKRLWGSICFVFGLQMKLTLFHFGLFRVSATSFERLDACADSLLYAGTALLGIGVMELFAKIKDIKDIKETKKWKQ